VSGERGGGGIRGGLDGQIPRVDTEGGASKEVNSMAPFNFWGLFRTPMSDKTPLLGEEEDTVCGGGKLMSFGSDLYPKGGGTRVHF